MSGAAPSTLAVTFFRSFAADVKTEQACTLDGLAERIRKTSAREKHALPWLKLARFGEIKTEKKSLRHDANVLAITGIEVDYDDEKIQVDDAVERLTKAGLLSIVYTSPSHSDAKPRWRVLCPTSQELPPGKRKHLVGRINGLFEGTLANESWTLSQSYYLGSVNHNPAHRVEIIDGEPIDALDELDEVWRGPPDTKPSVGNSIGPIDEPALIQAIIDGKSYHEAAVRLLGRWARASVPYMDARRRLTDAMETVFPADRDLRWKARMADVDRCLEDIYGKEARKRDAQGDAASHPTIDEPPPPDERDGSDESHQTKEQRDGNKDRRGWMFFSPTILANRVVPERRFIVDGWLPAGTVSINFGDGGVGKTLLAQQLMTSTATARPWCGLAVEQCKSLALFCEDDEDELHRRQEAINIAYNIDYEDLAHMQMTSGVGHNNALVEFGDGGTMFFTAAYNAFSQQAKSDEFGLLVIDTAADTFGGNENVRREVRQFIGHALGKLAKDTGAAVLLNAHPSRTGLSATGDLDGGSTAWSNTARSRWSLSRPKTDGDENPDQNARILTRRKANYASTGDTLKLRWQRGVLVPADAPSGLAGMAGRQGAETTFLALLARFTASGIRVSQSKHGANWAPKEFAKAPDRQGHTRQDFETAMGSLLADGRIEVKDFGRPGRPIPGLVAVT